MIFFCLLSVTTGSVSKLVCYSDRSEVQPAGWHYIQGIDEEQFSGEKWLVSAVFGKSFFPPAKLENLRQPAQTPKFPEPDSRWEAWEFPEYRGWYRKA